MSEAILDLDEERADLVREIEKINIQLSDMNRIDPETGERLTGRKYADWRKNAQVAKSHKLDRLREVNLELKKHGRDAQDHKLDVIADLLVELIDQVKQTNVLLEAEYEEA